MNKYRFENHTVEITRWILSTRKYRSDKFPMKLCFRNSCIFDGNSRAKNDSWYSSNPFRSIDTIVFLTDRPSGLASVVHGVRSVIIMYVHFSWTLRRSHSECCRCLWSRWRWDLGLERLGSWCGARPSLITIVATKLFGHPVIVLSEEPLLLLLQVPSVHQISRPCALGGRPRVWSQLLFPF